MNKKVGNEPKPGSYITISKYRSSPSSFGFYLYRYKQNPWAATAGTPPKFVLQINYGSRSIGIKWGNKHDFWF